MASKIYLALGTNIGQRRENLQKAIDALGEAVAIEAISPVYETEPWGIVDQPYFLNLCLVGQTNLSPREMLATCKSIERELGREPGRRWGPRLIDIDIIFYDGLVYEDERLTIPHPSLAERAFVLAPLADIAPNTKFPGTQTTILEMLSQVDKSSVERLDGEAYRMRRPKRLTWGIKTYVMGIVNVTPDSFSGDGVITEGDWLAGTIEQADAFVAAGADILDIGGESTRPGSQPVDQQEELNRIVPVIEHLRKRVDVPISVDTYRATVARAALSAGADWVNDVWGLRMDPGMVELVAETGCPVVIMHNRSQPKNVDQQTRLGGRYVGIEYQDLIGDIIHELNERIEFVLIKGVIENQIIVDPGIGFGKTVKQNLQLLNKLDAFKKLGYPILVGPSRKSFIGYTLDLPPEERLEGTAATIALAIDRGADIVRVHDVKYMVRVARMMDAIIRTTDG